jgi:hypothetical protein
VDSIKGKDRNIGVRYSAGIGMECRLKLKPRENLCLSKKFISID